MNADTLASLRDFEAKTLVVGRMESVVALLAYLAATPTATVADVLAWAQREARAAAPDAPVPAASIGNPTRRAALMRCFDGEAVTHGEEP